MAATLAETSVLLGVFEDRYMEIPEMGRFVGSPGKNGTDQKSIQRRLIITFIHSYYIVTISKIVVSIVCYRFIASSYWIATYSRTPGSPSTRKPFLLMLHCTQAV